MRRRGITMTEMMVVLSATSIILFLGGRAMHTLLRAQRNAARNLVETAGMSQFARDFRRDAHAAVRAELQAGAESQPAECRLVLTEGRLVVYRANGTRLQRNEFQGEAAQGEARAEEQSKDDVELNRESHRKLRSRESYAVPSGVADFEALTDSRLIAFRYRWRPGLSIDSAKVTSTDCEFGTDREFRVVAALARDYRFGPTPENSNAANSDDTKGKD